MRRRSAKLIEKALTISSAAPAASTATMKARAPAYSVLNPPPAACTAAGSSQKEKSGWFR